MIDGMTWNVWLSWWLKTNVMGFTIDPNLWKLALWLCILCSTLAALRLFGGRT